MNRKIIILIAVVVVLLAAAAYYFLLGGEDLVVSWMSGVSSSELNLAANTAPARPGDAHLPLSLSKRAALSPVLSLTGGTVWYFDNTGQLYRTKLDGTEDVSYGLTELVPISKALWPPAGNDFIIKTAREGAAPFRYYDSQAGKFVDLPGNVWELAWLPDGKRIVYVWRKPDGKLELQIADPNAANFSKLADLPGPYLLKAPLAGNFVLLEESPVSGKPNRVFKFDLGTRQMTAVLDRGRNLDLLISPDGNKLLFTRVNESSGLPELWLADLTANTFKDLALVTSIDKVVWDGTGNKFYYALPESVASGDTTLTGHTQDSLHLYDFAGATSTKLSPAGLSALDMRDLILADNGDSLVFRNGVNGRLFKVSLK